MKTCPKCGAVEEMCDTAHDYRIYECGTSSLNGGVFDESDHCTRRQRDALERELAAARAEIEIMRKHCGDRYPNARQLEDHARANRELAAAKAELGNEKMRSDLEFSEHACTKAELAAAQKRIAELEANQCEAEPAWIQKIIENIGDNPTIRYEQLYRKAKR